MLLNSARIARTMSTYRGFKMNPTQVSARFAAYVWFTGIHGDEPTAKEEANRFARENWTEFLPCAQEGLGKLLIRLSRGRQSKKAGRTSRRCRPAQRRSPLTALAAG
jgi:hypothetical protein